MVKLLGKLPFVKAGRTAAPHGTFLALAFRKSSEGTATEGFSRAFTSLGTRFFVGLFADLKAPASLAIILALLAVGLAAGQIPLF